MVDSAGTDIEFVTGNWPSLKKVIVLVISEFDELETMMVPVIPESFAGTPGQYHDVVKADSAPMIGTASDLFANSTAVAVGDDAVLVALKTMSEPIAASIRTTEKMRRKFIMPVHAGLHRYVACHLASGDEADGHQWRLQSTPTTSQLAQK